MSTYLKPEADRLFVEGLTPTSSDQAWGQTRLGLLPIKIQNLGDANATIGAGTTIARLTATLTQPRIYTLPSPASYPNGNTLIFSDVNGLLNTTNYATLYAGAATINGASSKVINIPYASPSLNSNGLNEWVSDFNPPEYGYVLLKQGNNVKKFESSADTNVARMDALKKALQYAQLTPSIPAVAELSQGGFRIPSGFPLSTYVSNTVIEFSEGSFVDYENPEDATSDYAFYTGPRNVLNFGALPTSDDFNAGATAVDCLSALKSAYNSLPRYLDGDNPKPITGTWSGETPPPLKGNGTEYTTTAVGFAAGTTSIPVIAGTGNVLVGDIITFNSDSYEYTVTAGVSAPGTITIASPGLIQSIPPNAVVYIKGQGTPLRLGTIYFPAKSCVSTIYYTSDTWYIYGGVGLIGENKHVFINFKNNVATAFEKYVVYMLSNESHGPGAANTFNAYINNISIRGNRDYNAYSSGLRFSCAQRGVIEWLGVYECSLRGFVTEINGGSIDVGYLNVEGITRGPGISLYTCYNFSANQIVSSFINRYQWAKDSNGDYYPALYAKNCQGTNIQAFQAEDAVNGAQFVNCNGVNIPVFQAGKYTTAITNVTNTSTMFVTASGHGRSTGDKVTITGVQGNTNANVTNASISAIDINTFALTGLSGNAAYTGGGVYLPGNNAGVLNVDSDMIELGLHIGSSTWAYFNKTNTSYNIVGSLLGSAIGKYSNVPRLDDRVSFLTDGSFESRTGNVSIAAVKTLVLRGMRHNTLIYSYPVIGSDDSVLQMFAAPGSNNYIDGAGNADSLCIGTAENKPMYLRPNRTTTVSLCSNSINLSLAAILTADPGLGAPGTLWRRGNSLMISTDTIPADTYILPLSAGGTGSPTASGARTNIGLGTTDSPSFSAITLKGSLSAGGSVYVSNSIKGKLTTDNAFSAVPGLSATGFITLYDSTGTAYKVLCTPYS